jgi:conjugative relaxase-like TrwC/TraI family protein
MAMEMIRVVRDPNYYLEEASINTPTFEGNGAKLLGISGEPITPESFTRVFNGYTPEGIRLPKYMHPHRRGAFEITVNLPKCGSVMNQLAQDSRIDEVLGKAADAVALTVQKHARVKVTKKSEVEKSKAKMPKGWKYPERKPDNLIWVSFDHAASRAGDPHRHRHMVFMNLSYDRQEKTWKGIELRYVDQPALSKLFRDETIKGLRQLGYKVKPQGKEYEIVGVPAEVKAEFSRRHNQIKEIEREYDSRSTGKPMSSKERSKLSLYHRPEKALVATEERRASWLSRISPQQFSQLTDLVRKAKDAVVKARIGRRMSKALDFSREMVQEHAHGIER